MDQLGSNSSVLSESNSSFQRWQTFRPVIEELYLNGRTVEDKKNTLSDVISIMKRDYGFDAGEKQYKYQLRKWNVKKNNDTKGKAGAVCKVYKSRSKLGKCTKIKLKGGLTAGKLQRQIKAQAKEELALITTTNGFKTNLEFLEPILRASRSILLNWNMPHRPTKMLYLPHTDAEPPAPTPSDMSIDTPSATAGLTPMAAPSPLATTIQNKAAIDRGRLFIDGKHDELIRSMNGKERLIMSQWLYQFWLYAFKTAKYWGLGPHEWTAQMLGFDKFQGKGVAASPNTPGKDSSTPGSASTPGNLYMGDFDGFDMADTPSDLCRWAIHIRNKSFQRASKPNDEDEAMDIDDDRSYKRWRRGYKHPSFAKKMRGALESNHFSIITTDKLPVAVSKVLRAAESKEDELLLEALGFSIMARNFRLMMKTLAKVQRARLDVTELYPFHLATSYIDGSGTCCNILNELCFLGGQLSLRHLYVDDRHYTVLDNLMIAIIKSHTSCRPGDIDATRQQNRFPGEEVDICGRWDADSDCFRLLLAKGKTSIPFQWKHKFCHTSTQAICHCINTIFGPYWAPEIDTPSGLFLKHCGHCGLRLELLPLHTLVVVALQLAQRGREGEDLFGILAVLLCLLRNGADPAAKTELSIDALLGSGRGVNADDIDADDIDADFCAHEERDAYELAAGVPDFMVEVWSMEVRVGWQLFCQILQMSRDGRLSKAGNEPEEQASSANKGKKRQEEQQFCDSCAYEGRPNFFDGNKKLGVMWAAAQTELLTYRRIEEDDSWISRNFNMTTLLRSLSLEQNSPDFASGTRLESDQIGVIDIELVSGGMMEEYCECGNFLKALDSQCVGMEEVSSYYFANMEDWFRTKFIHFPDREWWEESVDEVQHEAQSVVGQASEVQHHGYGDVYDEDDDDDEDEDSDYDD